MCRFLNNLCPEARYIRVRLLSFNLQIEKLTTSSSSTTTILHRRQPFAPTATSEECLQVMWFDLAKVVKK
ncbi:unnamed protein product [Lactuca virosa]|uniref:Uncharacterized protein n=1 Tax=Lactuca virosa TaxID=75947 RepID=A0AAU9LJ77_9ASTR|nr:unnamed protein product [Lactuca virosa]